MGNEVSNEVDRNVKHSSTEIGQYGRERYDLAIGPVAQSAQFNVITIVLGVVLGALLFRLTTLDFAHDTSFHLMLSVVLASATLIAAIDLWIKYAWGLLLFEWPFEPAHNFIYFFIGATQTAMAVTIDSVQRWVWFAALLCIGAVVAYVHNSSLSDKSAVGRVFREGQRSPVTPPKPKPWLWDRSYLIPSNWFELTVTTVYALLMIGGVVLLNSMSTWHIFGHSISIDHAVIALCWAILAFVCSITDITIQSQVMKNQRELYIQIKVDQTNHAPTTKR